jgi:hypothetical protein
MPDREVLGALIAITLLFVVLAVVIGRRRLKHDAKRHRFLRVDLTKKD